jgi:Type I phosphodiesterase / nucleotide pyrophosphatase
MTLSRRAMRYSGVVVATVATLLAASPAIAGNATLNLVLVLDGLRPDAITAEETPHLWRLRQEGVNFANGHAVFPTVTRANATAIATGTYPDRNGIFGNTLYVREVDPKRAFGNDDHRNLLRLDAATGGKMVLVKSLAEMLAERGKSFATVSSGSTGSALLGNPRAPKGVGILINGYWDPGTRVAFPDAVNDQILRRFPAAPRKGGAQESHIDAVTWTQQVLRDYVLGELKPNVILNWLTEPDHLQHALGSGSPEARAAIRSVDREVGLLVDKVAGLGLAEKTNIIVVSDHGFGHSAFGVDLTGELIKAGLKAAPDSDDVVIASSGQAMALHVRDHDPERIGALVRFLQKQPWAGVLFTAGKAGGSGAAVEGREARDLRARARAPRACRARSGHRADVSLELGEERVRRARHRLHRRGGNGPARGQRRQSRQHEPVDGTQYVPGLGRRFQARHDRAHTGEQRRSGTDAGRADESRQGHRPQGLRRARAERGLRRWSRRGEGADRSAHARGRDTGRQLPRRAASHRARPAALCRQELAGTMILARSL